MLHLMDLPDDLFSNYILKYLPAADVWRLGAVCKKFHRNDPEKTVVQREFKERDNAFILSQQYTPESPIMSVFDCRQRVFLFERCSIFAWEMTRDVQQHQARGFSCKKTDCKSLDLHTEIPELANGLRDGKIFMFFAQFTCNDELLWEGFLRDYNPKSDIITPMDDLVRKPDGELIDITEVLGAEVGNVWIEFQQSYVEESDVELHLDTGNVSNLTKDHVNSDLHVALISLIYSPEQPGLLPELRLHYSFQGCPQLSSPHGDSPSVDILHDQDVTMHHGKNDDHATPFLIWKSKPCLHSLSLLYNFGFDRYIFDCDMYHDMYDCDVYERDDNW